MAATGSAFSSSNPAGAAARPAPAAAPQGNNPQNGSGQQAQQATLDNITDKLSIQGRLSYPAILSKDQTFIRFTSYDYSSAQDSQQIFGIGQQNGLGDFLGKLQKLSTATYKKAVYSSDKIDLYVPPNINIGYGANWGEAQLGSLASQYNSQFNNVLSQALGEFGGSGSAAATQTGANALASFIQQTIPDFNATGSQVLGLLTGLVYNKNEFSTFSNMNFRTFTYSFLLVGRNQNEIDNIQKIINVFKIAMHPRSSNFGNKENVNGTLSSAPQARPPLLKFPKIWTIQYFVEGGKTNDFIPKTKFCGLQSFNTNYTPNSVFTTLSSQYGYKIPAIQMDLTFKELTTLIADEIIDSSITGIPNYEGKIYEGGINNSYEITPGGTF